MTFTDTKGAEHVVTEQYFFRVLCFGGKPVLVAFDIDGSPHTDRFVSIKQWKSLSTKLTRLFKYNEHVFYKLIKYHQ